MEYYSDYNHFHEDNLCSFIKKELHLAAVQVKNNQTRLFLTQVAKTLHLLGLCLVESEQPSSAKKHLQRALEIEEGILEPGHEMMAVTLHEIGQCVREVDGPGKAEVYFRRALKIEQMKLGTRDIRVADTLHRLGQCIR